MSRIELIPLHLPIPELAGHPRMTRAKIDIMETDLIHLSATVRVLEVESLQAAEPSDSEIDSTE
jgi:exoribonuclease-2